MDTQLYESTCQNSLKVSKVVKPTNKKTYLKTLWIIVINSPLSPLSGFQRKASSIIQESENTIFYARIYKYIKLLQIDSEVKFTAFFAHEGGKFKEIKTKRDIFSYYVALGP